ncbi:capsular polysaccharide biosynthesis protein [Amphritea sp.]|uniref:capsular polysaccharide biosynthesis protein n=1 Tax=Amphritea sp. TaxID=1872502 RepID=UPI003A9294C7
MKSVGVFSKRIYQIPYLNKLLDAEAILLGSFNRKNVNSIAGWGLKPTSLKARRFAKSYGIPYISLEDGFIRSLDLGVNRSPPHSLIADYTGIYYDASSPSDLENLILRESFDNCLLNRAKRCLNLLKHHRLSKYNHAPDTPLVCSSDRHRVLVVDQTVDDASVIYGRANASRFIRMLDVAIRENPDAEVCVKVHPDVIAGYKKGYLFTEAEKRGCTLISQDMNPWALFDAVKHVYVVTSQLGFEALIAGKPVSCFGLPFYSGWGLTNDDQSCDRRNVKRTLVQVFAAAYLKYCRYINPYTGQRCELEDTIDLISDQKRQRSRFDSDWLGVGFASWKRNFVPNFLGKNADIRFYPSVKKCHKFIDSGRYKQVLIWSSDEQAIKSLSSISSEFTLNSMEDGFIRSVGLGADLVEPLSMVIDRSGIYYDPSLASDLEIILETEQFADYVLERARLLVKRLVELKVSKYNVGRSCHVTLPTDKRVILVPGQVGTDASIMRGSPIIKTNHDLLRKVRNEHPLAFIVYKPHPDVLAGARVDGGDCDGLYDLRITDISMPDLLEVVDEVHTLTSLTGFEALLRGKKVYTYGMPFYAGWGLTYDYLSCSRRTRILTLDQLVAATLIYYPLYADPISRDHINVETALELLQLYRQKPPPASLSSKIWKKIRKPI